MGLEQVIDLQNKIDIMKKYYFKGFSTMIASIYINSHVYIDNSTQEGKELILNELINIETLYTSILFQELDSNEDFAPLFVIRELLPKYAGLVRDFIENPADVVLKDIGQKTATLTAIGEVYRNNFNQRLDELRRIPGYENFNIFLVDYKGDEFVM